MSGYIWWELSRMSKESTVVVSDIWKLSLCPVHWISDEFMPLSVGSLQTFCNCVIMLVVLLYAADDRMILV